MKQIILSCFLIVGGAITTIAQTVVNEATLEMLVETVFPEGTGPTVNAPEGATVMRIGDAEIKSKLFFKMGNYRLDNDMGMGKNSVFYDASTKTTTTLMEMMGKKFGFYTNDADMKKMQAANDSGRQRLQIQSYTPEVFIEYLSETKKIAGMLCNKAILRYKNSKGEEVQQSVWYSPEFKLGEDFKLNGMLRMANIPGLQKLKGYPMEFDIVRQNGAKIHYQVTKVNLNAKVDDKLFLIPKDYEIKAQSEMNRGGRPGEMQFRING